MIAFQKILKQIDTYGNIEKIKIEDQTRGKENIFIVGLPRSGTTLLEFISANKQVFAGGEMKALILSIIEYRLKMKVLMKLANKIVKLILML